MKTVVIPLIGENWPLIQDAVSKLEPERIMLCHTLSRKDLIHTNSLILGSHLIHENQNIEVETIPLNCSDYPLALGQSFAGMLTNDFSELREQEKNRCQYDVLITQNTPLGYFFGITALSGSPLPVSCFLGSTSADISKTQTRDFNPTNSQKPSLEKFPLFEQIQSALSQFNRKNASRRIFSLIVDWHEENKDRYNSSSSFRTSDLVTFSESRGVSELQSTISNHVNQMIKWDPNFRLIDSYNSTVEYQITSLGRTVGWVMKLSEE